MNDLTNNAVWLEWLLEGVHRSQWAVLQLLHALGLTGEVDGQAAWPFARRIAGENLLLDQAQARQFAISLLVVAGVVLLLAVSIFWKRGRRWLWAGSVMALVLAPWPSAAVLLTAAYPTSFHASAVAFSDRSITRGAAQYAALCVQCHGVNGKGQGEFASAQTVWPPNFSSPLLWRRADGDLLWAIRHGVRARDGVQSMPAFASSVGTNEAWELLHYLRALAAGELLSATGNWPQPVHLPDMQLRCQRTDKTRLSQWQGQRLLMLTADPDALLPDPRMVTIWLPARNEERVPDNVDCVVADAAMARQSMALINGSPHIDDTQWLTDRRGWLRARNARGAAAWSDDDLLCKSPLAEAKADSGVKNEDQLTRIIRTMDAEPVRFVKGGRVH